MPIIIVSICVYFVLKNLNKHDELLFYELLRRIDNSSQCDLFIQIDKMWLSCFPVLVFFHTFIGCRANGSLVAPIEDPCEQFPGFMGGCKF